MEDFVRRLETGRITRKDGRPFTESARRDFKICLRKFYKWLLASHYLRMYLDERLVVPTTTPSGSNYRL
jgi:hypothetical protein